MSRIRDSIERSFERLARLLFRHAWLSLAAVSLLMAPLLLHVPRIQVNTSAESLLREGDPTRSQYEQFRQEFGRSDMIVVMLHSPRVFDPAFLRTLKSVHEALAREVPYVDQVTSLINARQILGRDDTLEIRGLLEGWPEQAVDLARLEADVLNTPLYVDYLVSEDGEYAAVVLLVKDSVEEEPAVVRDPGVPGASVSGSASAPRPFNEKDMQQVVESVRRVAGRFQGSGVGVTVAGGPVLVHAFNRAVIRDLGTCVTLLILTAALILLVLFRRVSGVLLPLLLISLSVLCTVGLMALLGVPLRITTSVIPAFLLAVGVGDSVHVLAVFYRRLHAGVTKQEAVVHALRHCGLPIVMTSLTTAAGLLSFAFAELTATAEMGIFAAIGVLFALGLTLLLLPPLLAILPLRAKHVPAGRSSRTDRGLLALGDLACRHASLVLLCALLLVPACVFFLFSLRFSFNVLDDFPDSMPIQKDFRLLADKLKGAITLEIIVDTGEPDGLYDPGVLERIDRVSRRIQAMDFRDLPVGKVFSVVDIVKEIHRALHRNDPSQYRIPRDRGVVAQELFLFECSGSGDLDNLVDGQFRKARISVKAPYAEAMVYEAFVNAVEAEVRGVFGDDVQITLTGSIPMVARTVPAALRSMAESYLLAFLVIAVMMVLLVADLKLGLISLAPNVLPIVMVMGIMGALKVPLDINTLMIGSIAIGIVVDDTVHFLYHFRKHFETTGDVRNAVRETLLGVGRAMLVTSLVLASGFFVLLAASLNTFSRFGFFTGITVLIALLSDLVLLPAILQRLYGRGAEASCPPPAGLNSV